LRCQFEAHRTSAQSSASHFAVPVFRALLDELDLSRRQVEQGVNPRVELRLQSDDLDGARLVLGAAWA